MADKPNILIIWGDDIGISNLSCYSDGADGVPHPEHRPDRRARASGSPTTTASRAAPPGRAAFITGQNPYRTGLTKVGMPGAAHRTAGRGPDDRDGAEGAGLRHRPVRQEPLRRPRRVPADPARLRRVLRQPLPPQRRGGAGERRLPDEDFRSSARSSVRAACLHTWANGDGTQRIEDTGPLTKKRMETCDEEFRDAAVDFIERQTEADTPFFVWFNTTHMHFRTHPKPESIGRAGPVAVRVPRHDARPRRASSAICWTPWTNSASPTTRSSCTPPTTART